MEFLDLYNYSMILLVIPLVALSFVAIKYTRTGRSRLIAALLFLIATAYTFIIPLEFTSYAKSVTMEWFARDTKEAVVLWGSVHPDTLDIIVLLTWRGQAYPRYYKLDDFKNEEEKMRAGEQLQDAMKKSQEAKQQGGEGIITMDYPFLSQEEREARKAADAENEGEQNEGDMSTPPGYEEDDSNVFHVAPPPKNEEKK